MFALFSTGSERIFYNRICRKILASFTWFTFRTFSFAKWRAIRCGVGCILIADFIGEIRRLFWCGAVRKRVIINDTISRRRKHVLICCTRSHARYELRQHKKNKKQTKTEDLKKKIARKAGIHSSLQMHEYEFLHLKFSPSNGNHIYFWYLFPNTVGLGC